MPHSKSARLPKKPHKDFPLYVHRSDRWAKKVRGSICYFGKATTDPKGEAALALWLQQRDELLAGQKPRAHDAGALLLVELCDRFLASRMMAVESQRLSPRSWAEYKWAPDLLLDTFGRTRQAADVRPEDFQSLLARLVKRHGLATLGREITMVRSVFKYGFDSDLMDRPVTFGPDFKAPRKSDKRKARTAKRQHEHGKRLFSAEENRVPQDAA